LSIIFNIGSYAFIFNRLFPINGYSPIYMEISLHKLNNWRKRQKRWGVYL